MSTRTTDYMEAVQHLPAEAMLVLEDVSWQEYERLLDELKDNRPGMRLTYDHGRLEIMSPSRKHEQYKELITAVIGILAEELHLRMQSSGSTTWKREDSLRAVEPDACFHIANAELVAGKDELDLKNDPPPDLVVEIDVLNESQTKFPVYAALGVPEIWRYVAKHGSVIMYELRGASYVEVNASHSFPILTSDSLTAFVERGKTEGEMEIRASFRGWVRGQKI